MADCAAYVVLINPLENTVKLYNPFFSLSGKYGKMAQTDWRVDAETNPHGILETLEKGEDKIS